MPALESRLDSREKSLEIAREHAPLAANFAGSLTTPTALGGSGSDAVDENCPFAPAFLCNAQTTSFAIWRPASYRGNR